MTGKVLMLIVLIIGCFFLIHISCTLSLVLPYRHWCYRNVIGVTHYCFLISVNVISLVLNLICYV